MDYDLGEKIGSEKNSPSSQNEMRMLFTSIFRIKSLNFSCNLSINNQRIWRIQSSSFFLFFGRKETI